MRIFRIYCVFFALNLLYSLSGCSNSYTKTKPLTRVAKFPAAIERARENHRYFIMQSGLNLYSVTSVDLDRANKQMTVTLDKVDSSRLTNVASTANNNNKQSADTTSSSPIYLFMVDSTSYTLDEPHTIPLNKVNKIEFLH